MLFGSFVDIAKGVRDETGSVGVQIGGNRVLDLYMFGSNQALTLEPDYAIDWDIFESTIQDALDDKTVGYAYEIGQGHDIVRSGAGGSRLLSGDGGPSDFTVDTQSQAFSTSKL